VLAAVLAFAALAIPPAPEAHVNDYAHVLVPAERQALERRLTERESATGVQMAIAIFPSLEGESLEDYSIRLAQQWRIGQKKLDTGVILLVFLAERKMRVEVGYGLEAVIPDAVAAQIIRESMAPRFREGRYAAGLDAAVSAVFARIGGEARPSRPSPAPGTTPMPVIGFFGLLLVVVAILVHEAFSRQRVARRNVYTAGGSGWQAPVILPVPWWRGGGGGGGGGFGGGGGDGGGFTGGGGSFGGGGASGDW
jgi:uncharacterized protein